MSQRLERWLAPLSGDQGLTSLLRHSGVLYVAGAVSTLLALAQQLTTARFLGSETYGRFAIVLGGSTLVLLLLDVRTWELVNKFLASTEEAEDGHAESARTLTWLGLTDIVLGTLSSLILIVFAGPIATYLLKTPDLVWLVRVYALSMPFRILAQGTLGALPPFYDRYSWLAVKSVGYALLRLVLISGAAYLQLGLLGVLVAVILAEVLNALALAVMAWLILRAEMPGTRLIDLRLPRRLMEIRRTMGQFWVSATLKGLHLEFFIPVLALVSSPSEVGLFRSGLDVAEFLRKVVLPVSMVLAPSILKRYEQGSAADFVRYIRQSVVILAMLTVPVLLAIVALGPWLLPAALGAEFVRVVPVAIILSVGYAVGNLFAWIRPALVAVESISEQNLMSLVAAVLSLTALWVVAPEYGALGGAATMTGFFVIFFPCSFLVFYRGLRTATGSRES